MPRPRLQNKSASHADARAAHNSRTDARTPHANSHTPRINAHTPRTPRAKHITRITCAALLVLLACSNNPYPDADSFSRTYYTAFPASHRYLDPAQSYSVGSHKVTGLVYGTLLEYHYLKRPYELIAGLAREVPVAEPLAGGGVRYRFRLRDGVGYGDDPCFELSAPGATTREAVAQDIAFQLHRLADPALQVQVRDAFSRIEGFGEFMEALSARRRAQPAFAARPLREQYAEAGGIPGVQVRGRYELDVVLREPYPQLLYWFAMAFTTPVPWEAVAYYDEKHGRVRFADHPVGTGPYRVTVYEKNSRVVLEQNQNWYGRAHPDAPGARYPSEGAPGDAEEGLLQPRYIGRALPFLTRIEMRLEKEGIPLFNKFIQGYYDASRIIKESFDSVVQSDRLTPEMAARGIRLQKTVNPGVFYIGFNMEDATVGAPAGERGRKLRQAMSLAVDSERWIELFLNGRGLPAQNPVPPVLAGYPHGYENPWRQVNLERARALLSEAGYAEGRDPQTGKPLHITFDVYALNSQSLLEREFFVNEWRKLGIQVDLQTTTYNEFQAKVERGAYQLYFWGWSADYPDPENFLFLLTCDMRRIPHGGPNSANFCNARYDALFSRMEVMENGPARDGIILQMLEILRDERPWVEVYHGIGYSLVHDWVSNVKPFGMSHPMHKYYDVDPARRAEARALWNEPVVWPVWLLLGALLVGVLPGVRTFFRERQ